MKMETYRIIASSGTATLQGKTQNYVMLIGLSINFHLHYLEALKKNLLMIAAAISLLIILVIRIAVRQGHLPLRNVSNAIKNITSETWTRGWSRPACLLSWNNWSSPSTI